MYLLDSDTLVFMLRGRQKILDNYAAHLQFPRAMSVISYGELHYGALRSDRPVENTAKVRHLGNLMPIIEVLPAMIETYATIKVNLEKQGNKIDEFDLLIAATALYLSYTLVTNNERHFRNIPGLKVENWAT